MRMLVSTLAGCLLGAAALSAQTSAQAPVAFEVASVRPAEDQPNAASVGVRISGSQVRITYFSLRDYLSFAFGVRDSQIIAPDWLKQARFDVAGKLPDGAKMTDVPKMLQALLIDRFELKTHHEQKEFNVYALTLKDAAKLAPIKVDDGAAEQPTVNVTASGNASGLAMDFGGGSSMTMIPNKLEFVKVSAADIVETLTRMMDRPAIDATGLTGRYTVTIPMLPEDYQATLIRSALNAGVVLPPPALRALDFGSADPFSNTLEKYGLKLESRKANLDVFVIDAIRRTPTAE